MPKRTPRKETAPKSQKAPAVVMASCMLTNVLVTTNAVVQLTDEAIELPGALNFGGRISAVISHGKGPTPKEKAATKMMSEVIGSQPMPAAVSASRSRTKKYPPNTKMEMHTTISDSKKRILRPIRFTIRADIKTDTT